MGLTKGGDRSLSHQPAVVQAGLRWLELPPWPSMPGGAPPGQADVPQAGLRSLALVERVAGALVVEVTPPSPSGSGRVLEVVAPAGRVIRRTALWILGTFGMGYPFDQPML